MPRIFLVIIDGLGIGAQEDAADYGDEGADTLGHVCAKTNVSLPNFERMGLGNIKPLTSVKTVTNPLANYGKMREISAGKDSTTGHWELAGVTLDKPFPTYPEGFPADLVQAFCRGVGVQNVLCNLPYSGTKVIEEYGKKHMETGFPILYTSADSVFQVACHNDVVPISKLYEWCEFARNEICIDEHAVGRVIARPFTGTYGRFERISDKRHDYSLEAPLPHLMSVLEEHEIPTYSIGKVIDLFPNVDFTQFRRTKSNEEGISQLLSLMSAGIKNSFTFVNLIDTDQLYGHRQDPSGYAECLKQIDRAIPAILEKLDDGDLFIFTGDHGNDPTDNSTDHTREFVPLLVVKKGSRGKNIGIRSTFSDIAETIIDVFGIKKSLGATSFKKHL